MMDVRSTIDDVLRPNRYLLKVLGFWPMSSDVTIRFKLFAYFRIIMSIFVVCSLWIPQVLTIVHYWGDISILAELGCTSVTVGQLVFKMFYMVVYQSKFCRIYQSIRELWLITDEKEERRNFEELAELARRITIIFFITSGLNIVAILTATVLAWKSIANQTDAHRDLPLEIWYGCDTQRSPNFEIAFAFQCMAMVYGVTGVVGFDATMMALILHICGQFRLIRARFRTIGGKIHDDVYPMIRKLGDSDGPRMEIGQCIEHHLLAIRIAKEMNAFLSPVIFLQLMTSGIAICLAGYALMVGAAGSRQTNTPQFAVFLATMFLQLVVWCWPGELLIQESTSIGNAICHEMPWYMLSASQQLDLKFVVSRTQRECQITALSFQVMSLSKLTDVFNTAASYFALLRSVSE